MGAAGDMMTAALLEIVCRAEPGSSDRVDHNKLERFVSRFNGIGIPGVTMKAEKGEKKGVTGTITMNIITAMNTAMNTAIIMNIITTIMSIAEWMR